MLLVRSDGVTECGAAVVEDDIALLAIARR
jgi:hypothetical protein